MTELIPQAVNILSQAPELLKHPVAVPIITGFVQWLSSRMFAGKKKTQETLATITRGEANAEEIAKMTANLEYVMEDNEKLRQELQAKLKEVESGLNQAGIQITKTNTLQFIGSENQLFKDISNSRINASKIGRQINQGHGSTYNENN